MTSEILGLDLHRSAARLLGKNLQALQAHDPLTQRDYFPGTDLNGSNRKTNTPGIHHAHHG
jgi:hypothetical protein